MATSPFVKARAVLLLVTLLSACACTPKKPLPPPPPTGRCDVDLAALELFSVVGSTARAKAVAADTELIGGPQAQGAVGDFLLENDRIRVVIGAPGRTTGPSPYGGAVLDADLKRPAGQPGRDAFTKLGLFYGFGRTVRVEKVEVLKDGEAGGYAVVAATGADALDDTFDLPRVIEDYLGPGAQLTVDPTVPVPLLVTTYYVLSPGENRVRALTALCNTGHDDVVLAVGDLYERSGGADFFNPQSCAAGLGGATCPISQTPWVGYQADGVAYALRAHQIAQPASPETLSVFSVRGTLVALATGADPKGLLPWAEKTATRRPGEFGINPGQARHYLRDVIVARDLSEVTSSFLTWDASPRARLNVTVTQADASTPAANTRVAVIGADGKQRTLLVTDSAGKARADLPAGNYTLRAGALAYALTAPTPVTVPSTGEVMATLLLGATQTLTVQVADPWGAPLPAKVVVTCSQGNCAVTREQYRPFFDVEPLPADVAAIENVGPSGMAALQLPPGLYGVYVSHGPEHSAWPSTFPAAGQPVDLSNGPAAVQAVLARVVDTEGWLSADLHLHSNATPGSAVTDSARVAGAAAEGLDVLVGTDRDWVTKYAPGIAAAGLSAQLAGWPSNEVSPFAAGTFGAFGVTADVEQRGGGFDWAAAEAPALRLEELFAALRLKHPGVLLQLNQPRRPTGALTALKVDTATSHSQVAATVLRTAAAPGATMTDTRQFSDDFDAIEVSDGAGLSLAALNDWMTFLSRGKVKTATAGSASMTAHAQAPGYGRTWAAFAGSAPTFSSSGFSTALKAQRAVSSSGPFIRFTAQRLDMTGAPVGSAVSSGELLAVHLGQGETVELTVDVQAPEWLRFDLIEIHTHAEGRAAANGMANETWPAERVHLNKVLDPTQLPVETLPAQNGVIPRRVHVTEKFKVIPTADTWYAAVIRSTGASRSLAPMVWGAVECTGGLCTARDVRPWAVANAVLIDADESGGYDHFPLP